MSGYICSAPLYEYTYHERTWRFEYRYYGGPWPVRKDGEPFKRASESFWEMFSAWIVEPNKESFRIGGGCQRF